jgi:hypothetical protein
MSEQELSGVCDVCGAKATGFTMKLVNKESYPVPFHEITTRETSFYCDEHAPKPPKKEPRKVTDPYGEIVGLARMGDSEFGGLEDDPIFDIWEPLTKWTTEPPTVEGLYRVVCKDSSCLGSAGDAAWVEFAGDIVWGPGSDVPDDVGNYSHWLGPIPAPEPPEE